MKILTLGIGSLIYSACCAQVKPVATANGWKTEYVTVKRVRSSVFGPSAEFTFPNNWYNSDRAEVSDFFEAHGGHIFEGGGFPGAPAYVVFDDVTTKDGLDKKLLELLPALDQLMRDLNSGKPIHIKTVKRRIVDKHGKEWPECVPPDPKDRWSDFNNNMNVNGTQYKCSAEGHWVVDDDAMKALREAEHQQTDLLHALGSRKLTHAELMRLTPELNIFPMQPYFACEKYAELYDLLVKQWELQTGNPLPLYVPLSSAKGEYNSCPQEQDNERAVQRIIFALQSMLAESASTGKQ